MRSIRTIAWSPLGNFIATGSADRTLRIWNPEKPQVKSSTELRGHTGPIERVAWNPTKEAELASVSSDGTCKFWDVKTKTCTATVALGGDGLTIVWAADGSVVIVGRKVWPRSLSHPPPQGIHKLSQCPRMTISSLLQPPRPQQPVPRIIKACRPTK